eukprot:CAMPEP_0173392186 /NCGR_PEP_ID=MMETSP1356-20130122/18813_1 /TAXON_ID=77927 ORGANISM="Hemiselmis virescens, Strain PCC157" /NCGR_SAMPLE_ID=MMETSP1356 /ASSEMBLY_ACC=CAM_ASM_000847 /LENGTH=282 /DNA_ID=CAMNT_0014349929 /DNA_START=26 /DNA_END=874 /DNA_ORIENTATION=+
MPAAPNLFKSDLAQKCLGDDYKYEGKVEAKSALPQGVAIKGTVTRAEKDGKVAAVVELKKSLHKVEIVGKIDHVGAASVSAEHASLSPGFTVKLEAGLSGKSAKLTADLKRELLTASSSFDPFKKLIAANGSLSYRSVSVGLSSSYCYADGKQKGFAAPEGAVQYGGGHYQVSANVRKWGDEMSLRYHHSFSKDVSLGVSLDQRTSGDKNKETNLEFAVGTEIKIDPTSTIKAKLSNEGVISAVYSQKIKPNATVKISGTVDTSRLTRNNAHKIGIALLMDL